MRMRLPSRRGSARGPLVAVPLLVSLLVAGWAGLASAQTPFVPYFGKNNIHYDRFDWHIYTTDHFEIYYYPEVEKHLERVASYAESAYQHVSADLKHDLSFKIPLIIFKTHSEFEQENVVPGAAQEGVAAFAEPYRQRMLLPLDEPPDNLYGLITHELTHQFQFDIIPQGLIRQSVPLWINEGGAEFERGQWDPIDLMMIRDAAVADLVPKMTKTDGYGNASNPRIVPYDLGHAVYEFIEAKFGAEGVRQFLFSLRKSVIGGGEDAYEEALRMKPDEFDMSFERYLKERFKAFRDKERPADYGRDLAPNQERTHYAESLSIAPSPSGDLIATVTVNRKDGELDIVLLSSKDGSIVRNLTQGFDKNYKFDHIVSPTGYIAVPWMSWSPRGDRLAYFVRTEKERTLIVQNVLTRKIETRIPMKSVDEPESPNFSSDGRTVAFSAMRGGIRDIYTVDLESSEIVNLTTDDFFDYGPSYSPDSKFIVYTARVSGNLKLFRIDLDTKQKKQLSFGTNDETPAQFIDEHTLVFSSTATDPSVALDPEVAKNGNIYNLWTLDLNNGELKQYTDALGGVFSPIVLKDAATANKIAFISYYKGDFSVHTLERKEPIHTAASSDFGAPGPIIDFQAPLQHTLVAANSRRKKSFEKMFLEGRPPVNVGVTNNGDVFGGTEISFGDVLGDKQVNLFASSIAQYRTLSLSYVNLGRRFQYALQGYSQTQFFYGQLEGVFYDPSLAPLISRDAAVATRTVRGGSAFGIYPLDRFRRLEVSGGVVNLQEQYNDPFLQQSAEQYQQQTFGQQVFRNGTLVPLSAAFVSETTVFREFGPLAGSTMRFAYDAAPKIAGTLSRQTFDGDARYYQRLASTGVLAMRIRGFKSIGAYPDFLYFGGNSEMRGYDYLQFVGQNVAFANAELRFPIIEAALTPIGVIGGIRGVFFADIGGGWFNNQNFKFATSEDERFRSIVDFQRDATGAILLDPTTQLPLPVYGPQKTISGFRLKDGRASYGLGLETFALGFPIHFDWSWRTLFNSNWEDQLFSAEGAQEGTTGSKWFRQPRFAVWIGYDF